MQTKQDLGRSGAGDVAAAEHPCPKCAGKLVQRIGKFGPFFGCANYPKCRHTEKK